MAFAYVQSWSGGSNTPATSSTLTVSGATSGNLLIGVVGIRTSVSGSSFTTPAGWTLIVSAPGDDVGGAYYYRVASGTSADNFAANWGISKRYALSVSEFSGLADPAVLETSNENETLVATSQIAGGTATTGSVTPTTAGAAIAFLCVDHNGIRTAGDITIGGGFTKSVTSGVTGVVNSPSASLAYLDLSDTTAKNPTWTAASSTFGMYAGIAVFAEAGGGTTITADGVAFQIMQNQFSPTAASRLNGVLQ